MHHLIFPSQDAYISNKPGYPDRNFGLDEILQVGVNSINVKRTEYTKLYVYELPTYVNGRFDNFNGTFTGSFSGGNVKVASGSLTGSITVFSSSYFSGSLTASLDGGVLFSGSTTGFSGSISSSFIDGWVTGSLIVNCGESVGIFTGTFESASGVLTGYVSGSEIKNQQNVVTSGTRYIDRSLVKFNISSISSSVASGDIIAPKFTLKLKTYKAENLPIEYSVYIYPVSHSWVMGNGYYSDGGSAQGVNWYYRDFDQGTLWYPVTESLNFTTNNYLEQDTFATESFGYGGGTWYYSGSSGEVLKCSQSFNYESSDVGVDVTPIVMAWISGSVPNEGFIVMHSHEVYNSSSYATLKFYSKDTNTIYSPRLDAMWDDSSWVTGSLTTASSEISVISAGISSSVQSGSTFTISGGIKGVFSASAFLLTSIHYITASNTILNQQVSLFSGSFTGSFSGVAEYISGSLSGSGVFTSSYFSGSIDGIDYEIINTGISSSLISGSLTGSVDTTGSVGTFTGLLSGSSVYLYGTASGYYLDSSYLNIGGIVDGVGLSGNIIGLPVVGNIAGLVTNNESIVTGPCGAAFTASIVSASFTNGIFSGSTFTAYYVDYKLENAILTGSWTELALLGTSVNIPLPSGIDPFVYAHVNGVYVYGKALGTYTLSGSISGSGGSSSASFSGQFVDGNLLGGILNLQLSGSMFTSSYSYTSSVSFNTSSLVNLSTSSPFVAVVKRVNPTYKAGDVVKIGVFGRKQFPLKNFTRSTQQTDYLVPEYLPTSSYYSIKDNETEENIIGFDNYTRMSCEYPLGNYFILDTTGLAQERRYRILIRVQDSSSVYTFDNGDIFKITR